MGVETVGLEGDSNPSLSPSLNLEHPRSVRDLDHLVDPHARVQLMNLSFKLRFRVFSHESLDLADKSEEVSGGEGSELDFGQRLDGGFNKSSIFSKD